MDELAVLRRQARARPLLSAAEESHLARRIERGDLRAKERMIECNLRLVFAIAREHQGRGVPFADLVQEGTIGLVRAVERFDHRREVKFSTYAVWWIRQTMREAIAGSQLIRIPRRASVETLPVAPRVTASLDDPVGDGETPLRELVADETAVDPPDRVIERETMRSVPAMLRLLPERHRCVLERRYGMGRLREHNHREIGEWLGVGEERSRQIELEALRRLRSVATVSLGRAA
jgi:RNA polymerase sigma factor (sigma-70 family)